MGVQPEVLGLTRAQRAQIADEMATALRRHVAEAWFPRCVDDLAGGFRCSFDHRWRPGSDQERLLEFQARQTRAAAALAHAYPDESRWSEYAWHGFTYLRDVMWDHDHGGWFRLVGRDGVPRSRGTKHAHSAAYAVQACARVFTATGEPEALDLANEGLAWWMLHGHDPTSGGFHGWLRRDGSVIRSDGDVPDGLPTRDPLGHPVGLKDINVLGDWLESLLDLEAVAPGSSPPELVAELLQIHLEHATTSEGQLHYSFLPDWTPVPGPEQFGYSFQATHRLLRAEVTPALRVRLRTRAHALADHAVRFASARGGGFVHQRARDSDSGSTTAHGRFWWVQVEALRALAACLGDRDVYASTLRSHWSFIQARMFDHAYGGVFESDVRDAPPWARRAREIARRKGHEWKDAAHETDALLAAMAALGAGTPEHIPAVDRAERDGGAPTSAR